MNKKATPRPWTWTPVRWNEIGEPTYGPQIHGPEHWHYDGNDSPVIARDVSTEANAELIVRAVNAHDELIEVLDAVRDYLNDEADVPGIAGQVALRLGYRVEGALAIMMAPLMTHEQARESWVSKALDGMKDDDAVRAVVKARFGKAVVFDPSSPESNKLALDAGYKIVHGPELSRDAWQTIRRAEALPPAGKLFPSGRVAMSPNGTPPLRREEWTKAMERCAEYSAAFAHYTCDVHPRVDFYADRALPFAAICGGGMIAFNLSANGLREAVDRHDQEAIDRILIHECAHFKVTDHLTHEFHNECCRIGAKARSFPETL